MTMLVSELEGAELSKWVALAQEWKPITDGVSHFPKIKTAWLNANNGYVTNDYRPDINSGQAMDLVVEFKICLGYREGIPSATIWANGSEEGYGTGEGQTSLIAACRAVVASVYGESVPDEESE